MSFSILNEPPASIVAGDAVSFYLSDSVHPATSWTASAYFKDAAGDVLTFARNSTSGTKHLFVLTNANTGTLVTTTRLPGKNLVCFAFSDGTHREVSDWQEINILADPTADVAQTYAEQQVELLESVLAKFNATTHSMVSFNSQSFQRANIAEYRNQYAYWKARVYFEQEQARADRGLPTRGNRIPVQFVTS